MKALDPGHKYLLDSYDGDIEIILPFVKREGDNYPGNVGHYPGTLMQEVFRACIDRAFYVDQQEPHDVNPAVIYHLRAALRLLEERAKERHIEQQPTGKNGHI